MSGASPFSLRPFGRQAGDLAVDFAALPRPHLITQLLAHCSQLDESELWDMPVGLRTHALLALAATSNGRPFEWQVRCAFPDCAVDNEIEITLKEIDDFVARAYRDEIVIARAGDQPLRLRRPTGRDQQQWLTGSADPIASLLLDPVLDEVSLDSLSHAIDQAMDEFDPLVGFHLSVNCPECNRATENSIDLAACAIDRLWRAQYRLLEDVHQLASIYHWSESEILNLPEWRREAYLNYADGATL